ncbi:MAG: Ni,Fe-hydrogenase III large subunit [Gammaproteobacteria bacterium]|nr:Ni,Fe-hydrogenase III large subunit [Gammaproteobacteria bacterium]
MSRSSALQSLLEACALIGVQTGPPDPRSLVPATVVPVEAGDWGRVAEAAKSAGLRWSALWVDPLEAGFEAFCLLEGDGQYLVLRTLVALDQALPSHAGIHAAADRPERHAHDLLGIIFANAPDGRRWTRHQAWPETRFPLLPEHPLRPEDQAASVADSSYVFAAAQGAGVVEIPVGPIHAGIIEPGHFRFLAVGETVLNLEQHLGYVHKGIEKLAVGRNADGLARLAARVSGDSTVAHSWAACQALERATGIEPPPRALWLRAILAERERIANHIGDIGAICNDVGFSFAQYQFSRLREQLARDNLDAFGHRLMMDQVVPGGVTRDIDPDRIVPMIAQADALAREVRQLIALLEDSESLEDRLMATGRLTPEQALMLGVVGYVGRASGLAFDLRRDAPYPPYDQFEVTVPSYRAGDVAARARIRAEEIDVSLRLLLKLLQSLPTGPIRTPWSTPARPAEGLGMIDGWRGEIITYVRLDDQGRVARFFPRDPSWLNWPALELMMQGNIVPDFPVCNKSVNGSYSGHDL